MFVVWVFEEIRRSLNPSHITVQICAILGLWNYLPETIPSPLCPHLICALFLLWVCWQPKFPELVWPRPGGRMW